MQCQGKVVKALRPDPEVAIKVWRSIDDIASDTWQTLAGESTVFNHAYLSQLEKSELPCQWTYFGVYVDNKLHGLAFGVLLDYPLISGASVKVFSLGSPVNVGCPLFLDRVAKKYLSDITEQIYQHALSLGARIVCLRDFEVDNFELGQQIAAESEFEYFPYYLCSYLQVVWTDFDGYLASLKASERRRYGKLKKDVEQRKLRIEVLKGEALANIDAKRINDLWHVIYDKKNDRDQIPLNETYFQQMLALPNGIFFLLWHGSELVSFDFCLQTARKLDSIFCGYERTGGWQQYNRLMGYEIVRFAIDKGYQVVNFGISNEQVKRDMGCGQVAIKAAVSINGPRPLRRLVNPLLAKVLTGCTFREKKDQALTPAGPERKQEYIETNRPKAVIIGAGLSGLSAACKLVQSGWQVTLLESQPTIGGQCKPCNIQNKKTMHITGCNLFHKRFFDLLQREFGIKIPYVKAPVWIAYDKQVLPPSILKSVIAYRKRDSLKSLGLFAARYVLFPRLGRRFSNFSSVIDFISSGSRTLKDLLHQYASLNGIPADRMSPESVHFLRTELRSPVYPIAGVQCVPRAMERRITKFQSAEFLLGKCVEKIEVRNGKAVGVWADRQLISADSVISTLGTDQTAGLIARPEILAAGENSIVTKGIEVAALLLTLKRSVPLEKEVHTFSFIEPEVDQQLRQVELGILPKNMSFDLIVPENLDQVGHRKKEITATAFINCPLTTDKEQLANQVIDRIEQSFPGFREAIVWQRVITPGEYPELVGYRSSANEITTRRPEVKDKDKDKVKVKVKRKWSGVAGLYQSRWPSPIETRSSYTALMSGLECAFEAVSDHSEQERAAA